MAEEAAVEKSESSRGTASSNARALRVYNLRAFVSSVGIALGLGLVVSSSMVAEILRIPATLVLAVASAVAAICTAEIVSLYLRGIINFGPVTTVTVSTSQGPAQGELLVALDRVEAALKKVAESSEDENSVVWREPDQRLNASREIFEAARLRLSHQVEVLDRRARVNLVTGSATTVGAVVILLAFAFSPTKVVELSWQQLLSLYLPKLGVVLMLEVFALFFLRLYKSSLEDSRALHGDLDMLALKEVALITAWVDDPVHRLESARLLVKPNNRDGLGVAEGKDHPDPKAIAELVAAVAKIVRP